MSIKILQLHKRSSYKYKYIQDRYALSSENHVFALADGTTQSFNSELWAETITKVFVKDPVFSPQKLILKFKESASVFKNEKFDYSPNPAKASLERVKQSKGGTATFIGIRIIDSNNLEVISCGDTNLFLINTENKIKTFPFSDINSLDSNNHFINTEALLQNGIDEAFFKNTSLSYNQSDTIILATDALSRLILKKTNTIKELIQIKTFENLLQFCLNKWDSKELEEDDISAIIIKSDNNTEIKLICPPYEFEFPKEKEADFIPASITKNKPTNNSIMEMNEIRNQFNGVAKDMHHLKSKLKLHELLLMVTVSLLLVNIFMMYLIRPKNTPVSDIKHTETITKGNHENTIDDPQSETKTLNNNISETTAPTASNETAEEARDIAKSITKDEAKIIQQILIKAGYELSEDGIWGEQTEKAWQAYLDNKLKE